MEFSTPGSATLLLWTLMRGAALVVLATEAIFLWMRRREPEPAMSAAQAAARIFWAATPAVLLAGLALWCLSSVVTSGVAASVTVSSLPATGDTGPTGNVRAASATQPSRITPMSTEMMSPRWSVYGPGIPCTIIELGEVQIEPGNPR